MSDTECFSIVEASDFMSKEQECENSGYALLTLLAATTAPPLSNAEHAFVICASNASMIASFECSLIFSVLEEKSNRILGNREEKT